VTLTDFFHGIVIMSSSNSNNNGNQYIGARQSLLQAIRKLDAPLFRARGIHITAEAVNNTNNRERELIAALTDANGERIAWMEIYIYQGTENGKIWKSISFEEGWTRANLRRNLNKPKNKNRDMGYGTILRAVIAKAAKDAGFVGIEQTSAALTNENKTKSNAALAARKRLKNSPPTNAKELNNLTKVAMWRPVSSYIMNKLGFEGGYGGNKALLNRLNSTGETRKLWFSRPVPGRYNKYVFVNQPTPKLNAVVNAVFHPPRS